MATEGVSPLIYGESRPVPGVSLEQHRHPRRCQPWRHSLGTAGAGSLATPLAQHGRKLFGRLIFGRRPSHQGLELVNRCHALLSGQLLERQRLTLVRSGRRDVLCPLIHESRITDLPAPWLSSVAAQRVWEEPGLRQERG